MSVNSWDGAQTGTSTTGSPERSKALPVSDKSQKRDTFLNRAGGENPLAVGDRPHDTGRPRAGSTASQTLGRTPARSFYHRSFHGHLQPVRYSSDGLREQTAELASFALSEGASAPDSLTPGSPFVWDDRHPELIEEVPETVLEEELEQHDRPGESSTRVQSSMSQIRPSGRSSVGERNELPTYEPSERSALLDSKKPTSYTQQRDVESQKNKISRLLSKRHIAVSKIRSCVEVISHPKTWNRRAVWKATIVHPISLVPAVFLGLLLNVLDALSYGMILFPLGHKTFDNLGVDGISMFYVSTIVAQIVYSGGGSIFRGGIGSEMIEVVPFFHQMALAILDEIGEENPKSVLATTILAFAISSVLTGIVFFTMGVCGLGSLIGFFPRHILIGCIGGVGWFLIATGVEVSARLPGSLEYNLDTLRQIFQGNTWPLWITPLALAVILLTIQRFYKSNFLVGGYFIMVACVFYVVKFAFGIQMATLRDQGWVFDSPPGGKPWYHFYTLYDFGEVNWEALGRTIPAMFALTFFGVLHVPINVPALGISTGEDNLNVDRELIAHGVSNCLSGLLGSIQNYLVYTNSILFIDSGGNDRLAGLMLSAATFGIMLTGPVIIGYIPVMVVGALIFLLGIELLEEAILDTFGRLHRLEYATIIVIVVTMGVYDFVVGILIGIVLAALNFVVQTSQRTAIRATYSGQVAHSTVRRPRMQLRFLQEAAQQTLVIKLSGYLFFGTIVGVEKRIRSLLDEDTFNSRPLRFLVLDMAHINGVDFSAAEAFTRINRLLQKKDVQLVVSGLELDGQIGRALRAVGLLDDDVAVRVFETLNQALENCENKLLKALYRQQDSRQSRKMSHIDVPRGANVDLSTSYQAEYLVSSPRRHQLHEVATATLEGEIPSRQKWSSFKQPLPLLLQVFEDVSERNEDFWHRAAPYFERVPFPKGSVVFEVGDRPHAFYLLEEGILRVEYDLPQGSFTEVIMPGRPCGELPFFSDTPRTANMVAEKDSVVWQLTGPRWKEVQSRDAEMAHELLKVSLKLTKERMDAVTSYVLATAL